jgi:hypothetical protein
MEIETLAENSEKSSLHSIHAKTSIQVDQKHRSRYSNKNPLLPTTDSFTKKRI